MKSNAVKLFISEVLVAAVILIFKTQGAAEISWLWVWSPFWITGIEATLMMVFSKIFGEDAK